jgi:hypothetical protein
MFELYQVPRLTYAVDGVMSFYQNNLPPPSSTFASDGLVLSFNTHSTSVIPILQGKGVMSHVQRCVLLGSTPLGLTVSVKNPMGLSPSLRISPQTYPTQVSQLPHPRDASPNELDAPYSLRIHPFLPLPPQVAVPTHTGFGCPTSFIFNNENNTIPIPATATHGHAHRRRAGCAG